MRAAVTAFALLLVAAPAAAQFNQAPKEPRECKKLSNQIERYGKDIDRAQGRGSVLWEKSLENEIDVLATRRAERCPGYPDPHASAKFWAKVIDVASEAAWKYFTWNY